MALREERQLLAERWMKQAFRRSPALMGACATVLRKSPPASEGRVRPLSIGLCGGEAPGLTVQVKSTEREPCWRQGAGAAGGAGAPPMGQASWSGHPTAPSHLKHCCFSTRPVLLSSKSHPEYRDLLQMFSMGLQSSLFAHF